MELAKHIEADRKRGEIAMLERALKYCDEPIKGELLPKRPDADGIMEYVTVSVPALAVEPLKTLVTTLLHMVNEQYKSL